MYSAFNLDSLLLNEEIPNFVEFYDQGHLATSIDKKSTKNFEK